MWLGEERRRKTVSFFLSLSHIRQRERKPTRLFNKGHVAVFFRGAEGFSPKCFCSISACVTSVVEFQKSISVHLFRIATDTERSFSKSSVCLCPLNARPLRIKHFLALEHMPKARNYAHNTSNFPEIACEMPHAL